MSYILCKTKVSDTPFYIKNISANIYSIEELCYYLYNNLYLLDETLFNEKLSVWLQESLGLPALAKKLRVLLEQDASIGDLVYPVFKEISYLTHEEQRIFNAKLSQYEAQPARVRLKMKGDYLVENEKYRNALSVYRECLKIPEEDETGLQFKGSVYYNMGCAYARLFEMSEAKECLYKAFEYLHSKKVLTGCLAVTGIIGGDEELKKEAKRLEVDEDTLNEIRQQILEAEDSFNESVSALRYKEVKGKLENGDTDSYQQEMKTYLKELTETYHKNTGY